MPSFLQKLKTSATALYHFDDENHSVKNEQSRGCTRDVRSTGTPAAYYALYSMSAKQRRIESRSSKAKQPSSVNEDDDPDDPIIKRSMYPQMNGKRRSELEAEVRNGTINCDRAWTGRDSREVDSRTGRPIRPQHSPRRVRRPRSVETEESYGSDSDSDSSYSTSEKPEGRPVRVCIYPQAKYIIDPVKEPHILRPPSYLIWKRDRLPYDEYQILRRRQVMQRARDVLEPHYFHRSAEPKKGLIGHGEMQYFTEYHTERRRISRVQYAVRKAMHADLDLFSNAFSCAMTRCVQKERFCELSDVDGKPIDEQLMWNFVRMYRRFRDEAYEIKEPKLAMVRPDEVTSQNSDDARNDQMQQDVPSRFESGVTMRASAHRPVLVSRWSWDSSDGEGETTEEFTDSKL